MKIDATKVPPLTGLPTRPARWSIWKKLVVFPLLPVLLLMGLCAWTVISETISEPRLINGHPDDAPRMAALFLGFFLFVLYMVYLVCLGIISVVVAIPNGKPPKQENHKDEIGI